MLSIKESVNETRSTRSLTLETSDVGCSDAMAFAICRLNGEIFTASFRFITL
jgi:hypothetical protein